MIWFETERRSNIIVKRALLCGTLAVSLVILTITQSAIPALVTCYGDDGHRSIEISHNGSCRQTVQDPCRQTAEPQAKSGSDGIIAPSIYTPACLDIPLGNDIIAQQKSSLRKSFTHLIRLTLVIPTSSIAFSATSTIQTLSPPPETPALTMLSTVVLLS